MRRFLPDCSILGVAALAVFASWGSLVAAQDGPPPTKAAGLLRLQLPLTGNDDRVYQTRLERLAARLVAEATDDGRPRLVLEFASPESAEATAFERALSLARFLAGPRMAAVKTLAYAPEGLEGHAVLVALACEEIALAPDAEIGRAGAAGGAAALEPGVRASYEQIAESRRTAPREVVLAMIDPAAELVRIETDGGVDFRLVGEADAAAQEQEIVSREVLSPAGATAAFTGRVGRELGFVRYLASDREALARALNVSADTLVEDPSIADDWRPVMVDLDGPLTGRVADRLQTLIGNELEQNDINWLGVRINSTSGDWAAALRLAQTVAALNGPEVRTVAYVPRRAEGPAALVALSCGQLVMQQGATLGGLAPLVEPGAAIPAEPDGAAEDAVGDGRRLGQGLQDGDDAEASGLDPVLTTIRESLAPVTGRSWSLLSAVVDESTEVAVYSNRKTGVVREMSGEEVAALDDAGDWRRGDVITAAGERLSLDDEAADRFGVAWRVVEQFDGLVALYGFDGPPRTARPNWALELVEALASPGFAAMLLVIGVIGVYIELSSPGLGIGGFIAALAFLLFFWSKFLDGTADWLEVLLFVTGVVFILLEIVVLPGVGVFGLGGGFLVIAGLVLASQTFVLPKTEAQLTELRDSLAAVAGAGVLCLGVGMVLRHYLPQSPLFRRMTLAPPDEADRIEQDRRESLADYAHLVGRRGVATTDLLPAGRAEIDGEPVDVIADGDVIDRGEAVEVVRAQGSRVLVSRVRA